MSSNGTIPGYIPPHLAGKVDSFRQEPDGRISFRHDAAAQGEFGDAGGRKFISRQQYDSTFDKNYRLANMDTAMKGQYGLEKYPTNLSQQANQWVGGKIRDGLEWGTSSQGKATGTAALLSALAGGIGGTLLARRAGDESPIRKGLLMALLAGTAGAGISAFTGDQANRRDAMLAQKQAAVSDEAAYLRSVVLGASGMNAAEKAEVLRALAKMDDADRDELANKAQSLFGFGAGMYIARVLFSKGLIPPIVGGIIGASMLSSNPRNKPRMNPWGQPST